VPNEIVLQQHVDTGSDAETTVAKRSVAAEYQQSVLQSTPLQHLPPWIPRIRVICQATFERHGKHVPTELQRLTKLDRAEWSRLMLCSQPFFYDVADELIPQVRIGEISRRRAAARNSTTAPLTPRHHSAAASHGHTIGNIVDTQSVELKGPAVFVMCAVENVSTPERHELDPAIGGHRQLAVENKTEERRIHIGGHNAPILACSTAIDHY
jgi:hypothetical protein